MEKKKTLINVLSFLFAAAVALSGPLLYLFLVKRWVGDALMYSAGSIVFVVAVSFFGAVAGYLILKKALSKPSFEAETQEEEAEEDREEEKEELIQSEQSEKARELYPELFREPEKKEEEISTSPAYYEALTKALSAQKAEYVPEEDGETSEEVDDILKMPEAEEKKISDIYDLVPDTLPEGYTVWEEEEEEETEDCEERVEEEIKPRRTFIGGALSKALALILIAVLSASFGVISASDHTVYGEDGFKVHSLRGEKSYTWQDCERYEIAPSFFGDRLSVTLYMKDGEKCELLPSDLVFSGEFTEKYGTEYAYALHAGEKMTAAGAEKTVKERNTIESEFFRREEIGYYVQKLIE